MTRVTTPVLLADSRGGPKQWICADCFNKRGNHIMQGSVPGDGSPDTVPETCAECGSDLREDASDPDGTADT